MPQRVAEFFVDEWGVAPVNHIIYNRHGRLQEKQILFFANFIQKL